MRRWSGNHALLLLIVVVMVGWGATIVYFMGKGDNAGGAGADPKEPDCPQGCDIGGASGGNTDASDERPDGAGDGAAFRKPFQVIATIGDRTITYRELERYGMETYGRDLVSQLLERYAVELEAEHLGIRVTEAELEQELALMQEGYDSEAQFYETMAELGMTRMMLLEDIRHRLLLEKIATRDIEVTDEELDRYIAEHPELAPDSTSLHIQQIVVPNMSEAEEVLDMLAAGTAFEHLAAAYSDDMLYPNGDMGWVGVRDPFVPAEILREAASMEVGEISPPIRLPDDTYALIMLKGRQTPGAEEKARARERLRRDLALAQAPSLHQVMEQLLIKWNANVVDSAFGDP